MVADYTIISPPFENQTAVRDGETNVDQRIGIYTATTSNAVNALPASFKGSMVRVKVIGGLLHYHFSDNASGEVDNTEAASAGGNFGAKVGWPLADGEWEDVMCTGKYFVREADATCDVYIRKA